MPTLIIFDHFLDWRSVEFNLFFELELSCYFFLAIENEDEHVRGKMDGSRFNKNTKTSVSRRATCNTHGEESPYFVGWDEYRKNPYDGNLNPKGVI